MVVTAFERCVAELDKIQAELHKLEASFADLDIGLDDLGLAIDRMKHVTLIFGAVTCGIMFVIVWLALSVWS